MEASGFRLFPELEWRGLSADDLKHLPERQRDGMVLDVRAGRIACGDWPIHAPDDTPHNRKTAIFRRASTVNADAGRSFLQSGKYFVCIHQ